MVRLDGAFHEQGVKIRIPGAKEPGILDQPVGPGGIAFHQGLTGRTLHPLRSHRSRRKSGHRVTSGRRILEVRASTLLLGCPAGSG